MPLKLLSRILLGAAAIAALVPLRFYLINLGESRQVLQLTVPVCDATCAVLGLTILIAVTVWCVKKDRIPLEEIPGPIERVDIRKHPAPPPATAASVPKTHANALESQSERHYKKMCLACGREFPESYEGKCPEDGLELSRLLDKLAPGSKFSEYYQIVGPLGAGGRSKVIEAEHLSTHKRVAIKLLHSHLCKDEISMQRFQREAAALSKLSHPNLVTVDDFMISPDGVPFIVMELLAGESLNEILSRRGALPWHETLPIFVQICKGLSHAHSKGIIHRDLKPGNIMLVPANGGVQVKVVDFGLAKDEGIDTEGRLTATGDVFGSPKYMSPEQCQGKKVDRRADVYALGCLLFECLAGKAPFVGKNVIETLSLHMKAPVPEIPDDKKVPQWLVNVIHKSLQKDVEQRHQSIDDLGGELQDGYSRYLKTK